MMKKYIINNIRLLLFVLLLIPNTMKCQDVNILIKDYNVIEYVNSREEKLRYIRVIDQNLWFDFDVREIDDYEYKLNEYIEIDSYLDIAKRCSVLSIYVCINNDDKIIRYKCVRGNIYKISKNRVYCLDGKNWSLDADFELLPAPNKNCGELGLMSDKELLILKEISYNTSNLKIFSFVKCLPTSTYSIKYKYIKGWGRVEFTNPSNGDTYVLNKIDNLDVHYK